MTFKKHVPLLTSGLLTTLLFCLLVVASILLFAGGSLGWFAEGRDVTAKDMAVQFRDYEIDVTYEYTYNDGTFAEVGSWDDIFNGLTPGDTVTLRATYTNQSETSRTLAFSLAVLDDGEKPLTVTQGDATYYYHFGSQLRVTQVTVGDDVAVGDTFLVTPSDNRLYHVSEQTATDVKFGSATLATKEASVTVEVTIEFINYTDINQNVYQNFGTGDECCIRYLRADIS